MGIIERDSPFKLIDTPSDYEVWEQSNESAIERGRLVKTILEQYIKCKDLTILNLGPDNGNIPHILSEGNKVVNLDSSYLRLKRLTGSEECPRIEGNFLSLPFKDKSFDLIIVHNLVEQINDIEKFSKNLESILKEKSFIYLSTPNKYSILNIISDPYSGLPFAALSTRSKDMKDFSKYFIRLFSLNRLKNCFRNFEFNLNTIQSVQMLFNNKRIMDTSSHPAWIKFIKNIGLNKILLRIINNKAGFINSFLTPTFYLMLKKES